MHIAIYHPARIPPTLYGGTERVLSGLAKALLSLNHQVTLVSHAESLINGAQTLPCPGYLDQTRSYPSAWNLEEALPSSVDLIHFSATPHLLPKRKPFLITIHGNGKIGETFHSNTVFISKKHAENHGSQVFVHNGIDPSDYKLETQRGENLAFLAKASWKVKNLKGAIDVARKSRLDLHIMGSRPWPPLLHHLRARIQKDLFYHGMVGDREKQEILKRARALLFPVRWHEPFGLAVLEALATGCPVFATPYGALPEIITPNVGHLSTDPAQWANVLREKKFSPEACRRRVLDQFTHIHMAKNYLRLYQQILDHGSLDQDSRNLFWRLPYPAESLLNWGSSFETS